MPAETFSRSFTPSERLELQRRIEAATSWSPALSSMTGATFWLVLAVSAAWFARRSGMSIHGVAAALGATAACVVGAVWIVARQQEGDDAGPWYLFDVGGDRALLFIGTEFETASGFPSTDFEVSRTTSFHHVLEVRCTGEPLVPRREYSSRQIAPEFWYGREVLHGPFDEVVHRVFGATNV